MIDRFDARLIAINQRQHMEIILRVVVDGLFDGLVAQREIQQIMLAHDELTPAVALAHGIAVVDQIFGDVIRSALGMNDAAAHFEVNRARLAGVAVQALIVVQLVGVGADGQRTDFQNNLIAAGRVDGAGGNHHLRARERLDGIDVLLVVDQFAGVLRAVGQLEELLAAVLFLKAQIGAGALTGGDDIVALVLTTQLAMVGHDVIRIRMALYGHIAAGMIGIVVIEADREIAAELIVGALAQQLFALRLHERKEGRFELHAVHVGHEGHLERNHIEYPGGTGHFIGQIAQLVNIAAAPHALQIHRPAAEGALVERVKHDLQRGEGHHLHIVGIVGVDVQIDLVLADQLPAAVHGAFKVDVIAAPQRRGIGERIRLAQIGGLAVFEVQHGMLGHEIHPHAQIERVAHLFRQRAAAVHNHQPARRFGRGNHLFDDFHAFRVLKAAVAALIAHAVEQHGVERAILGQVGRKHPLKHVVGLEQVFRGNDENVPFLLLLDQAHQHIELSARIAVDANGLRARVDRGDDFLRHGQRAQRDVVFDALGHGNVVDGLGIVIGVGMEHEAHDIRPFCREGRAPSFFRARSLMECVYCAKSPMVSSSG